MIRRLWFIADLLRALPIAWQVARIRSCDRDGGHRWIGTGRNGIMEGTAIHCSRCPAQGEVQVPINEVERGSTALFTYRMSMQ
jgi:hypothetical protein